MSAMPDSDSPKQLPARHAGPYGFSRRELIALLVVLLLAGGGTFYRWWQRQSAAAVPTWIVENVVLETEQAESDAPGNARELPPQTATAQSTAGGLDLNSAGVRALERLPGIGPVLAERIIADRGQHGPFRDLSDFKRVPGIGDKIASGLAGWVHFGTKPPADTAAVP